MMKCQSCGRPSESMFCRDCTDNSGALRNFDEIVENLTGYYVETQGFDRNVAKSVAIGVLSHQPAWEKKIKKEEQSKANFKKLGIVFMAIVVALTSGGIVYWLSSIKEAKSIITYDNISKKTASPFDNLVEKEVNGLQVFEMKCPGDQQIIDLSDSVLTFSSLEGSKYSKVDKLFNMDIDGIQGYPFDPFSIETREMLQNTRFRIFETYFGNNSCKYWIFDPIKGGIRQLKEDLILYNNLFYVFTNYEDQSMYACEIGTGEVNKIPYFRNNFSTSCSFVDETSIIVPYSDNYVTFNLLTGEMKQTSLTDDYSIFGGTLKYKIVSKTHPDRTEKRNPLYVYNAPANKLVMIDDDYYGTPVISDTNGYYDTFIFYQKYDEKTNRTTTFCKSIFRPEDEPKVISTDNDSIYPVYASRLALVYTTKRNKAQGKWNKKPDDEKALSDLWVKNLSTGQDYQLETGGVDRIVASESSVSWTKWQGSNDDQYFNVCFARMPPQNIKQEDYDSEGKAPYDNLKRSKVSNLDVVEMFCTGEQSFGKPQIDYTSMKRNRDGFSYDEKSTTSYFCPSTADVLSVSQYDPGLPMPTNYLFDPITETGVKMTKDSSATKRFLDDRGISIKWKDSDALMDSDNSMFMYDRIRGDFEISDYSGIPEAMTLKKVPSGDKTRIVYNDTVKDYELMKIDGKIDMVFIVPPKDNSMVFTIKLSKNDYLYESRLFSLDVEKGEASALGTDIKVLDYNSRYILIKPNINDMSSLKLFDRKTKELKNIDPNLKPIIGNLDSCKINNATDPDGLVLSWPYPDGNNNSISFKIAYSRLSEISTNPKIVQIKKDEGDLNLIGCLGDWILYNITGKDRFQTTTSKLFGYNIATGIDALLYDNFSSTTLKVGDSIVSTASRGYKDRQFNNVVFIKIR